MRAVAPANASGGADRAAAVPSDPYPRAILAASSACGGIGRRARLRALWTLWSVEVRVLSGALEKPCIAGLSLCSRADPGSVWERWLPRRKPHLEPSTRAGYEINGRRRLLPAFASRPLGALSVDVIRDLVAELAEAVEAGDLAVKTVHNALGTLVVCLNDAVEDRLIATNPALRVQRLPPAHIERDYLRLDEIARYLDACSEVYRPLAELLIGSGLRISEALGLRLGDLELEDTGGMIVVYRSRKKDAVGSTKSDRFRGVEIGPGLCAVLRDQVARRPELASGDRGDAFLFVMPVRTVKRAPGRWVSAGVALPLDRNTVSRDWHKQALEDAALRDMPLHARAATTLSRTVAPVQTSRRSSGSAGGRRARYCCAVGFRLSCLIDP